MRATQREGNTAMEVGARRRLGTAVARNHPDEIFPAGAIRTILNLTSSLLTVAPLPSEGRGRGIGSREDRMAVAGLRKVTKLIEGQAWLDQISDPIQQAVTSAFTKGGRAGPQLKDLLNGVWLGHSLHPVLTDLPIGFWTAAPIPCSPSGSSLPCPPPLPASRTGSTRWTSRVGSGSFTGGSTRPACCSISSHLPSVRAARARQDEQRPCSAISR